MLDLDATMHKLMPFIRTQAASASIIARPIFTFCPRTPSSMNTHCRRRRSRWLRPSPRLTRHPAGRGVLQAIATTSSAG